MNIARHMFSIGSIISNRNSVNIFKQEIIRCYSHNIHHRNPRKVFSSDGVTELESHGKPVDQNSTKDEIKGVIELNKEGGKRNVSRFKNNKEFGSRNEFDQPGYNEDDVEETVDDRSNQEISGTHYVRLSDSQLSKFSNMVLKTQARRQRERSQLVMLEGRRLIQDAILADIIPLEIYFSRKELVEQLEMPPGVVQLYKVPYRNMKSLSQLTTPPGIVAFCRLPKLVKVKKTKRQREVLPVTVICDNIREPGNLGSIIRTVTAAGCSDLILSEGCTDIWDPKTLRAGCGAHFRVNVSQDVPWAEMNDRIGKDAKIFLADSRTPLSENDFEHDAVPTVPYFSVDYSCLTSDIVIVIGGETEGLSYEALQMARYRSGVKINIPLENDIESLSVNAATSTILFEIKRQLTQNHEDSTAAVAFGNNSVV